VSVTNLTVVKGLAVVRDRPHEPEGHGAEILPEVQSEEGISAAKEELKMRDNRTHQFLPDRQGMATGGLAEE
jgi:hypothetical protein